MGPGRALPRGPGPPAPQRVGGEVPTPAGGGGGCRRPHGKPCWSMRSIPRESTPASSPHPGTSRMSSGACRRPSRRRGEKEGASGTSPQAHPHTHTPPRHPASVNARTPAAPTAPRPAAPRETRAPHNMTPPSPRPAAPPPNPTGRYTLGRARAASRRRSLPPQPSSTDSEPRTNPPRLLQGTAGHRDPHPPRPSPTTPEAPDRPTTATPSASRAAQEPTQPDESPSITPCSDPSLRATLPATSGEHDAEPRPEEATRTWSRWTPTRAPTATHGARRRQTQARSRQNRLTRQMPPSPSGNHQTPPD